MLLVVSDSPRCAISGMAALHSREEFSGEGGAEAAVAAQNWRCWSGRGMPVNRLAGAGWRALDFRRTRILWLKPVVGVNNAADELGSR